MLPVINFSPFPELLTERLVLRQLAPGDADEIYTLRSDKAVNEFLDRPLAHGIEDAEKFIDKIITGVKKNESIFWVIQLKDEPKLAGTVCLWNIDKEKRRAETGYELLPAFQGRGIMTEALSKIIEFGFGVMQLKVIEAWLHSGNLKSIKILEKNNFKRDTNAEAARKTKEDDDKLIVYSLANQLVD